MSFSSTFLTRSSTSCSLKRRFIQSTPRSRYSFCHEKHNIEIHLFQLMEGEKGDNDHFFEDTVNVNTWTISVWDRSRMKGHEHFDTCIIAQTCSVKEANSKQHMHVNRSSHLSNLKRKQRFIIDISSSGSLQEFVGLTDVHRKSLLEVPNGLKWIFAANGRSQ